MLSHLRIHAKTEKGRAKLEREYKEKKKKYHKERKKLKVSMTRGVFVL